MLLTVSHDFLPKHNSSRAAIVMDHFGIDFEQGRHVIAENLELPVNPGDVVLFTGSSGSGKSSLMRAAAAQLASRHVPGVNSDDSMVNSMVAAQDSIPAGQRATLFNIDALDLGERLLIDALPLPVQESMQLLSACGLGEAQLLLRTPRELSDGQRYRFRLALALAHRPRWIVADEFTATLDRTLAKVIAFNIRRLADRSSTGFLLATTHEDIVDDLSPDLHVRCRLDGDIEAVRNNDERCGESSGAVKKKRSPSRRSCGSARRPGPTGRISLGGITGAIMWGFPGL